MEITYLGYVLIPLGLWAALFFKMDRLLQLMIFFSPFTATSIINFTGFSLTPTHFFAIIIILRYFLRLPKIVMPSPGLSLFLGVALLSIAINAFCQTDVAVYGIGNGVKLKSSLISIQNITQFAYLLIAFLIYWVIKDYCFKNPEFSQKVLDTLWVSAVVVGFIGIYETLSFSFGLPFDEIFRSGNNYSVYWMRVSAVTAEPSFLASFVAPMLPISYFKMQQKPNPITTLAFLLICVTGFLSTSSTFLLGFAVFLFFVLFFSNNRSIGATIRILAVFAAVAAAFVFILNQFPDMRYRIIDNTIAKIRMENTSGITRSTVFRHMLDVGIRYPLFGVGFGSGRSLDMFSHILAGTGFLGFITFFGTIAIKLFRLLKMRVLNRNNVIVRSCALSLLVFLACAIGVPELFWLYFWCLLGVSDALLALRSYGMTSITSQ